MTIIARTSPALSPAAAFKKAVVLQGPDAASATFALADIATVNTAPSHNLAAGNTTLTLALMRSGTLVSTSSGATTLLVPDTSAITDIGGYTFDMNDPKGLVFCVERRGPGLLAVNFASGVQIIWNDLDPQYLPANSGPIMFELIGVQVGGANAGKAIWRAC